MKYVNYLLLLIIAATLIFAAGCISEEPGPEVVMPCNITGSWTTTSSISHMSGADGFTYEVDNGIFDVTYQEGRLFSGNYANTSFYGNFCGENATRFILTKGNGENSGNVSEILIGTIISENEIRISSAEFEDPELVSPAEESTSGARVFTLVRNGATITNVTYPDLAGTWTLVNGSIISLNGTRTISGGSLVVEKQEGAVFYGIIDTGNRTGTLGYTNFTAVMYGDNTEIPRILFSEDEGGIWFGSRMPGGITISRIDNNHTDDSVSIISKTYRKTETTNGTAPIVPDVTGTWNTVIQVVISENGYDTTLPSEYNIRLDYQKGRFLIGSTSYMGVNEGPMGGFVSSSGEVTLFKNNKNGGVYLAIGQLYDNTLRLSEIFTETGTIYASCIETVRT